jgi:ABC-type transport system involved in cytochrome bd biosynthesis fused ATPase/permease subunit
MITFQTRIFVTHNITYLPQVDHIIVLQNGMISQYGTYEELSKTGEDFASFLTTYLKDHEGSLYWAHNYFSLSVPIKKR